MSKTVIHFNRKLLAFREDAIKIKKDSKNISSEIILDFSGVYFISRAFADELLNVIEFIEKKGKKIHLQKSKPAVKRMLQLVKNGRKKIKKELIEVN